MSSMGTVLFSKEQLDSDNEDQDNDELDDQLLTKAYDRALRYAKEKVAKRIAESTNTSQSNLETESKPLKLASANKTKKLKKKETAENSWKTGNSCRAIYSDDGLEYEAVIIKLHDNDTATVKFIGYENKEVVSLSSLGRSLGPQVVAEQRHKALQDSDTVLNDSKPKGESKKKSKKNPQNKTANGSFSNAEFGNLPFCPIPPPPGIPFCPEGLSTTGFMGLNGLPDGASTDGALTSMLVSWYLSGYYTGFYQGLRQGDKSKQKSRKE